VHPTTWTFVGCQATAAGIVVTNSASCSFRREFEVGGARGAEEEDDEEEASPLPFFDDELAAAAAAAGAVALPPPMAVRGKMSIDRFMSPMARATS
jgi:hypothetical protein